jgi:hypothetical protein
VDGFTRRPRVNVGVDLDPEEAAFVDDYRRRHGRMGRATVLRDALQQLRERETAAVASESD